jgi:hypothetical protein
MLALRAYIQIGFDVGLPDGLPAAHALGPKTLRADLSFTVIRCAIAAGPGFVFAIISLEPGHRKLSEIQWTMNSCQRSVHALSQSAF